MSRANEVSPTKQSCKHARSTFLIFRRVFTGEQDPAACGRDVMPSIYSTDTPLWDVAQSLYITPVQCFTILSYVSRRRTTPAVYYRSSKFCAVPSASRVSALISAPAVSPAPACLPGGFGPGGLGTGGIVSVVCAPAVSLRRSGPAGPIISDPAISHPLPPQHTPT
jgi:hypothetical protein